MKALREKAATDPVAEKRLKKMERKRKRNLQQVMQESFFYGSNRFGNNFIA